MTTFIRRTLIGACLAALAIPAAAAASTADVAPPGSDAKGGFTAAARSAADPGCRAKNVISFRGQATFRVRHTGLIRCENINVRIHCAANLLHEDELISHIEAGDRNRCRIGTPFSESEQYPPGEEFTQKYRYKLKLLNDRKKWSGTTRKCPRRSNQRQTLTCKASHTATVPDRSVDTIRS
jgi:hypothetical protein